ncbi:MAG: NAD(P)/FAD-dependent oxidoreductase [Chloroflexota bacterium]|nr:NAD(P)/FAD-dependent oxidoreductase [Chloroflexota bacterium]
MTEQPEVIVVGAGINGLAAAVTMARAGRSVRLLEAEATVGGDCRSAALTLPGFVHDLGSAIHPLAAASPVFQSLPLSQHGLRWVHPPAPLAHPLDDGSAILLERSIDQTAESLDSGDRARYRRLMTPLVANSHLIIQDLVGPLRWPRHPFVATRFGVRAIRSATAVASTTFAGERGRALFAGLAAHGMLPLDQPPSAAFALLLGMLGHAVGWPFPAGGAQNLANALAATLREMGGTIATEVRVESLASLSPAATILADLGPPPFLRIAGDELPAWYRAQLRRYRYGPGVAKIDWALDGPIPWTAAACQRAGTLHLGGTFAEIAAAEAAAGRGVHPARPFVLLAQPSRFDPSRAPTGKQTAWAYCHVPAGSDVDMTEAIEDQIERFAPGFRDQILARRTWTARDLERANPNHIGGEINGGLQDLRQLFTRPTPRLIPYATPNPRLYLCSASTPPGGGVHGLCGAFAARAALRQMKQAGR